MCVRIQKQTESVVWNKTGDNVRMLVAHYGEDPGLVLQDYRRLHPDAERAVAIVYAHGVLPRTEFCTKASVAAAIKGVRSEVDALPPKEADSLRNHWIGLCERFSVSYRTELGK